MGCLKRRDDYDEGQFKIELFTPERHVVTIAEFFKGAVKKRVGSIRECEQEHGWAYTSCKKCNKSVEVLHTKGSSASKNRKSQFICEAHGSVAVASRFKVIMRIIDDSGSAPIVFFNNNVQKLSGETAWELMEKHGMDLNAYFPSELDDMIGKRCLFKIFYSEYNHSNNNHTYRCDAFSEDMELINYHKKGFLEDEDAQEDFTTPANQVKRTNLSYTDVTRVLDMQTPPKDVMASGSGQHDGNDKKRVFIDLDDIDSDSEGERSNKKTPKLVEVKVEKDE